MAESDTDLFVYLRVDYNRLFKKAGRNSRKEHFRGAHWSREKIPFGQLQIPFGDDYAYWSQLRVIAVCRRE
jgi:hypothetical protein